MSENRSEIVVGGVVLAIALAFLVYVMESTGDIRPTSGYTLTASFRSAQGVDVGTDVRLAGVKIGTVSSLVLNEQSFRADVELAISSDVELPDDSSVVVASEGLLGGTFVEIQPGGSPFNFEPGANIDNTQGAISLIELLSRFVGSGE